MKVWRKTDLAWAAGFVDGEGSFILRDITVDQKRRSFSADLVVSQTDRTVLENLVELFGGNITHRRGLNKNQSDSWAWLLHGERAGWATRLMLPYFRRKRAHARVFLKMADSKRNFHPYKGHPLPDEVVRDRRQMISEMRKLNARGRL